ncbi:uncharacterized protein TRIADDRAFT_57886 [Trichoplax adhaerens]|uniref:Uncharacterized protein n=1 Tax=Trichoplax adhaerens TaxID=10228 RepID=B3S1U3_TRIAD|nr:predicted protein [Trichoplax adhaerens]EDV23353.1 predicted protein [Trichoplax adhaerens]|eukprot:XP_002114263.1 predicted protein [Trichoplax adhaerens]
MESDEDYKSFRFQFKYKESKKMQDKEVYFSKSEDGWSQLIKLNEFKIYYELPQLQFNCSEAVKPECRLQSLPFGKCLVEDKCLGEKDSNSLFGEYFPGNCYQQPASCNGMTSNEITQTFATTIAARKIPYQSRGRVLTISIATQNSEVHSNSSGVQQDINLSRTIKYKEQTPGSCNFGPESADSFSQAVDADKLVFKEEYYRRSQIIDNTIMKSYEKIEDQDSAEENNTIRQKDRHILGKFRNEVNNMTESFNTLTVPQLADVEKIFFGFKRGIAIISVALAKQSCESPVILRTYLAKLYEGTLPEFLGKFLLLGLMQCSKFTVGDFPALSKYCASSRAIKYGFSYNCKVAYDYLDRKRSNELRTTVVQLEVFKNCTTSQGCESHRRDAVVRECEKLCPGCLEMDWYDSRELLKRTIIGEGPMMEYRQLASKSDISKLFKGGGVYHVSRGDVVISRKGEIRVKEEKLVVTTL